ncbi:MAG: hypothetical protein ABSG43_06340 [Solirubrobacteraceae bacterium]
MTIVVLVFLRLRLPVVFLTRVVSFSVALHGEPLQVTLTVSAPLVATVAVFTASASAPAFTAWVRVLDDEPR